MAEVPNPWSEENWNMTDQGAYIKKYGLSVASRKAKLAGVKLGDQRPKPIRPILQVLVQKRTINQGGGGTGGPGGGISGTGDPTG